MSITIANNTVNIESIDVAIVFGLTIAIPVSLFLIIVCVIGFIKMCNWIVNWIATIRKKRVKIQNTKPQLPSQLENVDLEHPCTHETTTTPSWDASVNMSMDVPGVVDKYDMKIVVHASDSEKGDDEGARAFQKMVRKQTWNHEDLASAILHIGCITLSRRRKEAGQKDEMGDFMNVANACVLDYWIVADHGERIRGGSLYRTREEADASYDALLQLESLGYLRIEDTQIRDATDKEKIHMLKMGKVAEMYEALNSP